MTKRGSNDRKGKARRIAKERDVRVTEAHSLLLQAKNRNDPSSPDAPAAEPAATSGETHELRIHRSAADGTVEVLDGDAAARAVWRSSPGALTAGCRCGWVNPHTGPRFPDLPAPDGVEPNEQKHWRWYQLAAWAEHAGDMDGEPTSAEYVQDPSVTINNVTIQVIFDLRLLLHHAQDDRETVAATYEAVESLLRTARIRVAHERARPGSGRQQDTGQPAQDEPSVSEEIPVSLDVLVRRTDSGRSGGYWELLAVELAAAELRRLVLQESQHAVSTVSDAPA